MLSIIIIIRERINDENALINALPDDDDDDDDDGAL